ncbi:beta-galactosidase [Dyella subtropica]|uniref:beta-galactosidase n=1 Tax=Dyella subtropica TaxID=2992127 RepID=UPI00225333B9|nr:beta-galactosidase [Dyella subtropica]
MNKLLGIGLCSFALLAACHASTDMAVTDLAQTGSASRITLDQVQRVGSPEKASDGQLQQRYAFQPTVQPQLVISPLHGSWDRSTQGELHLHVQNAMDWAVTLTVDIDGVGKDQHLHANIALPAGPAQTVVVPLHAASPRAQGMQVAPPMPYDANGHRILVATTVEGALDLKQVGAIRLGMPAPQAPQTLLLGRIETKAGDGALSDAYAGIVDRYGQYTRGQWPEKIDTDETLRSAQAKAQADLAGAHEAAQRDIYGGRLDAPVFKSSGWFRTERRDGRWQLVTPEGHAFFSLGVNAVVPDGGRSYVEGRESMFKDLPPASGEWSAFYGSGDNRRTEAGSAAGIGYNHGHWFDFYAANLYRLDGKDWPAAWRTRTLDRLHGWGFNTLGNWSDDALAKAHKLAYTRSINIAGEFGNVSSGYDYWGRMPDPFDPRFAQAAETAVANAVKDVRDDPWLLGYFADNELAWAGQGPQGRWGLAQGTLRGEARSHAKQAFIAALKQKYGEPAKLAAAWGITLASWEALNATNFAAPDPSEAHPAVAADYSTWLKQYADQYFRTVAEAIRRHDPHHLFLGGRFAVNTPEAVAACAQYCDVISFNSYTDVPQHGVDIAAVAKLGKPALITEFHFGSDDRGPFGKGVVSVWNEQQRGEAYARYIDAAMKDPNIVGAHWFQYADQPASGRLLDGENAHIGLVGITDVPFGGFVKAVSDANRKLP